MTSEGCLIQSLIKAGQVRAGCSAPFSVKFWPWPVCIYLSVFDHFHGTKSRDFTTGPNFLHSNLSVAFHPAPAHLWGAWVHLLFGPPLDSCRQQRLFLLPSLFKLNNPSCFSISSYLMCSSPIRLRGSPPDSCSKVLCCLSCGSCKCCVEGKNCCSCSSSQNMFGLLCWKTCCCWAVMVVLEPFVFLTEDG